MAPGRVVGVEGGEDQVAGQGGADRDVGRLPVADFADHDDVGVLAQDVAQRAGEGEPDLGRTCIWFTPGTSYSIGSSIVMIRRSVELICRRKALRDVLLPEPVGPVTRMMPCG